MSRASWYRALASVRIEMVQPGVARLWGSPRTRQQRIAAAVLSIGRGAVASHRSAAFLWGVERPRRDPVDLVVARDQRVPDLVGVEVHRPTDRADLVPLIRDRDRGHQPVADVVRSRRRRPARDRRSRRADRGRRAGGAARRRRARTSDGAAPRRTRPPPAVDPIIEGFDVESGRNAAGTTPRRSA